MTEAVIDKTISRLLAVQGIYSQHVVEADGMSQEEVIAKLLEVHGEEAEGEVKPNKAFLQELVAGVSQHAEELDGFIAGHLKEGWAIERLDALLHALLRTAVYELKHYPDTPAAVILDEYITIAHAFYEETQVGFVNGILDKIAQEVR